MPLFASRVNNDVISLTFKTEMMICIVFLKKNQMKKSKYCVGDQSFVLLDTIWGFYTVRITGFISKEGLSSVNVWNLQLCWKDEGQESHLSCCSSLVPVGSWLHIPDPWDNSGFLVGLIKNG